MRCVYVRNRQSKQYSQSNSISTPEWNEWIFAMNDDVDVWCQTMLIRVSECREARDSSIREREKSFRRYVTREAIANWNEINIYSIRFAPCRRCVRSRASSRFNWNSKQRKRKLSNRGIASHLIGTYGIMVRVVDCVVRVNADFNCWTMNGISTFSLNVYTRHTHAKKGPKT